MLESRPYVKRKRLTYSKTRKGARVGSKVQVPYPLPLERLDPGVL